VIHFQRILRLICLTGLFSWASAQNAAAPTQETGWSADLLNQLLKEAPKPASPVKAESGRGMTLRSYQLRNLHIGEAGRTQNLINILDKMLPAGSSVRPDVQANTLHILTSPEAHAAVYDYISAIDQVEKPAADAAAKTAPAVVPDEIKAALKKLAESSEQSTQLLTAVSGIKSQVETRLDEIKNRQRQQLTTIIGAVAGAVLVVAVLAFFLLRRRPETVVPTVVMPASPEVSKSLALIPQQISKELVAQQTQMRDAMMGSLNEVVIRLQAHYGEQQKQIENKQAELIAAQEHLAIERQKFISESTAMVTNAVGKVEQTTVRLAKQQDKVGELVTELQNTIQELDKTKDDLRQAKSEVDAERAKIAALSLMLEEGGPLPPDMVHQAHQDAASNREQEFATALDNTPSSKESAPCQTSPSITETPYRFRFMPPDAPEET
jgi:hypothetical protein